jgi:hypothetical protein
MRYITTKRQYPTLDVLKEKATKEYNLQWYLKNENQQKQKV